MDDNDNYVNINNNTKQLRMYDWSTMPRYSTVVWVASRRSGKSVMAREVLYKEIIQKRKIKQIIIVSPTLHNEDYAFIAPKYKFTEFDEDFLNSILSRQEDAIKRDPEGNWDLCLVLDDIMKSTDTKTRDILSRLFTLSRHYRLYVFFSVQSIRFEYTPIMRLNTDIVVLFKTNNFENKKEITNLWLGFGEKDDRASGLVMLDKIAQGYRTMVIDNTKMTSELTDFVFYYQTDINKSVPKNYYLD